MRRTILFSALLIPLLCLTVADRAPAADKSPMEQWRESKHSNRHLAQDEATWEGRQEAAAFCGRCHSSQGFRAWVPQLLNGDPGPFKKPDGSKADEAYIKSLGMTKDQVQPINCGACHSTVPALRIKDSIPMLPNGVAVKDAGKGALCMACHNTRNGRITWNSAAPKDFTQPHDAAQADVLLGKNVYFYDDTGDTASPHLSVGDACVTCHFQRGTTGHEFKPGKCSECHDQKTDEKEVQKGAEDLLKQLSDAVVKKLMANKDKIACVTSWDPKKDKDTPNTAIDGKQIKAIEIPPGIHGQISLKFKMQNGKDIYSQLGNIKDACGDQGKPVYATSDPAVRALWNYLLFTYDGSKGVHNPKFARNVLAATINEMSK